jgi:hypothetical protein
MVGSSAGYVARSELPSTNDMRIFLAQQDIASLDSLLSAHISVNERLSIVNEIFEQKYRLEVFEAVRSWEGC